ncbi:MAG TPA: CPBP family intramembrane glutamic endopeptidase [Polyangiaceae bacterium]|nr:CPBP family intramembrane glutamic endopeptidase [Polyangiaceae bacterium]
MLLGGAAVLSAAGARDAQRFALSPPGVMALALVSSGAMALVAALASLRPGVDPVASLRLARTRTSAAGLLAAIIGMAGLSVACGSIVDLAGGGDLGTMADIAHAFERATPAQTALGVLAIGVVPGLAEEAFFRGFIQTRLASRWGRWPAILATAAAFGVMHFDRVQGPVAFVIGLFLGWMVERLGGIRPSMAAHAFNNALFILIARAASPGHATRSQGVVAVAAGGVVWIASAALLASRIAVRPVSDPADPGGAGG